MKKDKERAKYESPQTTETIASLESGICAASADVQNPSGDNGQIEEHKINEDIDFNFKDQHWDEIK